MKTCSKCKETKPLEHFWNNLKRPDGKQCSCKECLAAVRRPYIRKKISDAIEKTCSCCKLLKPIDEFYEVKLKMRSNGRHSWCKQCCIASATTSLRGKPSRHKQNRIWKLKNPDAVIAASQRQNAKKREATEFKHLGGEAYK